MEEREKRKQERGESDGGLEIDWSSAPTEKTLLANDIDPTEVSGEEEEETGAGSEEQTGSNKPEPEK